MKSFNKDKYISAVSYDFLLARIRPDSGLDYEGKEFQRGVDTVVALKWLCPLVEVGAISIWVWFLTFVRVVADRSECRVHNGSD